MENTTLNTLRQPLVINTSTPDLASTGSDDMGICEQLFNYFLEIIRYVGYLLTCGFYCTGETEETGTTTSGTTTTGAPAGPERTTFDGGYSGGAGTINIRAVDSQILARPCAHLKAFAQNITPTTTRIRVNFLEERTLAQQAGIDAGGLSKHYINQLFEGVTRSTNLRFEIINYMHVPRTRADYVDNSMQIPQLSRDERDAYYALGKAMRFCHDTGTPRPSSERSHHLIIGRRFPKALFEGALTLRNGTTSPLQLMKIIVRNDESMGGPVRALNMAIINYLESGATPSASEEAQLREDNGIREDVEIMRGLLDIMTGVSSNASVDVTRGLHNVILGSYGHYIEPMRAIAAGLVYHPLTGANSSAAMSNFMMKIQGGQNRQVINTLIQYSGRNEVVGEKRIWITQWIADEINTSDREVAEFLKFITGCTAVTTDPSSNITINDGTPGHLPVAHTCFRSVEISPAHETQDAFIANLKRAIQAGNADGFQLG